MLDHSLEFLGDNNMSNPTKGAYTHSIEQTEADLILFQELLNQYKWLPSGDNFFSNLKSYKIPIRKR